MQIENYEAFLSVCLLKSTMFWFCLSGEALIPVDVGILDNYRVKKQLLHSW